MGTNDLDEGTSLCTFVPYVVFVFVFEDLGVLVLDWDLETADRVSICPSDSYYLFFHDVEGC